MSQMGSQKRFTNEAVPFMLPNNQITPNFVDPFFKRKPMLPIAIDVGSKTNLND